MIFVRHPKTVAAPGLCYGRLDLGIEDTSAAWLAPLLRDLPVPGAILTSPAQRCTVLARAVAKNFQLDYTVDERLQELDFGTWEGKAWSEIDRRESDPWAADPWNVAPPAGEPFSSLFSRVSDVVLGALENALVVCHAGVIRAARMILDGKQFSEVFAEPVPYCRPIRFGSEQAL